jgi:hypothetical protein
MEFTFKHYLWQIFVTHSSCFLEPIQFVKVTTLPSFGRAFLKAYPTQKTY